MKTTDRKNNSESGFSMVEALVSMAILAIIAAIAIPNLITFKQNSQLSAASRELFSGFQQAKMTAIKRNANCTITFNQPVAGTTYDYVVYVDENNDLKYDTNEEIIVSQLWEQSANIDSVIPISFLDNDEGNPSIAFSPYGLPSDKDGKLVNGTITLTNPNRVKNLELSIVGNVKITS
ncbi:GspH/FimT family protein [Desulfococcaceae bacterium HSG9]|nr:GspH/FimT family protein [Desulfococcaceae bacterium HSG9]